MKKLLFTIAAFSVLAVSCDKEDDLTPTTPTTPATNVKAGSKFTYQRTDYDNQTGTTVVSTTQYTLTMLRDSTINNEKWFIAERKEAAGTQYGLLKFAADGMYNFRNGSGKMDFKFNAAANDTWTNSNDESVVVKSINQSVTVPAGSYTNAIHIETSDANSMENKIWYNDKEYLLKQEEYDESPTQAGVMILDYKDELVSIQL